MIVTFLIISACLLGDPSHCNDYTTRLDQLTVKQCFMQAQPQAAAWLSEHPNLMVTRITCKPVDVDANGNPTEKSL